MERARDLGRRLRRAGESRRRPLAVVLALFVLFLLYRCSELFGESDRRDVDAQTACMTRQLEPFADAIANLDAAVWTPASPLPPFVGNGRIVLALLSKQLFVAKKGKRTPTVSLGAPPLPEPVAVGYTQSYLIHYADGLVYRFQCSPKGVSVAHVTYAHRTLPSLLVRELKIDNPTDESVRLAFSRPPAPGSVQNGVNVRSGLADDSTIAYAIAHVGDSDGDVLTVSPKGSLESVAYASIVYEEDSGAAALGRCESQAVAAALRVKGARPPRTAHTSQWRKLARTGLSISESKASGALNGDRINATVYAVLSQVASPDVEEDFPAARRTELAERARRADGCYEGHPTIDAVDLWKPIDEAHRIASVGASWLLTLERRGCHDLVAYGATGVAQAIALSLGAFHFSSHHLEFRARPSDLHRDFSFRRLSYGEGVAVNVSVRVEEDNTASIYASVEGNLSGGTMYACDAGCVDGPEPLGSAPRRFPVKLTEPPTAVLYVSSDEAHLQDLRHAIHVKEVALAPAHERHVIALHKHGHALGGLPTVFWASICLLIVVFHLFLCRIVMTEYCDPPDRYRRVYDKPR